ncbi:sodium-dependent glucose transporter 1-like [Pecten maximus]|uniref:sodium-dependent glucose transporter 1-like n=1 Tax=Pecten maximus TaxID=6579 RepID=UPI001457E8C3|nr:sodium-dependent glucose transporter 1-like [Pecten maximus]
MEVGVKCGIQSYDHDAVPKQDVDIKDNDSSSEHKLKDISDESSNCKNTHLQIIRSVCVSCAYMVLGWTKGQIGPAFLDILMISGANLEKGSVFMTSLYAGQLIGSLLSGFAFAKMNKFLLFAFTLALYSLTVAAIPWCFLYELMVAAFAFLGVCGGIIVVAVGSEVVDIWGPTPRGRSYLMVNSVAAGIASVVAPLVTAPFLQKQPNYNSACTYNISWNSTSSTPTLYSYINRTIQSRLNDMELSIGNSTLKTESDSKLYIAYTISAVLGLLTAVLFFVLFCQPGPVNEQKQNSGKLEFIGKRSILVKRLQLFNIGVFGLTQSAIDFTFAGYLAVFCINYLGWTKTLGATVTSVAFFARLTGTFSGIFLVRYFPSHQLLVISTIASTVGFIGLTISAHAYADVGIWISVGAIGFPFGLMWPSLINWININLIPFRNQISGSLSSCAYLGALLVPLLIGYMMAEVSLLWFCYLCCSMSVVLVINALLMLLYTGPSVKKQ